MYIVCNSSLVSRTSGESPRAICALHFCGVRFALCPRSSTTPQESRTRREPRHAVCVRAFCCLYLGRPRRGKHGFSALSTILKQSRNPDCVRIPGLLFCRALRSARRALGVGSQRDFFCVVILVRILDFAFAALAARRIFPAAVFHTITSKPACANEESLSSCRRPPDIRYMVWSRLPESLASIPRPCSRSPIFRTSAPLPS